MQIWNIRLNMFHNWYQKLRIFPFLQDICFNGHSIEFLRMQKYWLTIVFVLSHMVVKIVVGLSQLQIRLVPTNVLQIKPMFAPLHKHCRNFPAPSVVLLHFLSGLNQDASH